MTVQAEAKPNQIQRPSQVRKPQLGCVRRCGRIIEWWSCERDELCLPRGETSLQQTIVGQPVARRHEAVVGGDDRDPTPPARSRGKELERAHRRPATWKGDEGGAFRFQTIGDDARHLSDQALGQMLRSGKPMP